MIDNQHEKNSQKLIKLKKVIEITKLNNKGFAERLEVSPSLISDILNGRKLVPKILGQKLEDTFGFNRKWFDLDEDEMYISENKWMEEEGEFTKSTETMMLNVGFQVGKNNLAVLGKFMEELKDLADKYNIKTS